MLQRVKDLEVILEENIMTYKDWNIQEVTGYEPKTTFYMDFSIAEPFGVDSIQETYDTAFEEWKGNVEFVTELVMVLNWKMWEHYQTNEKLARLYEKLWWKVQDWCYNNLKGDDLAYFIRTTD